MADYSDDQAGVDEAERKNLERAKAFAKLSPQDQQSALSQISFPGQQAVLRGPPEKPIPIPTYDPSNPATPVPAASDKDVTQKFMQDIGLTPGVGAENRPGVKPLSTSEQRARDEESASRQDALGPSGKADVAANNRQKEQPLDPAKSARAEARLFGAPRGAGVQLIRNPGGWMPAGRAMQQSIGPDAPGADEAIRDAYAEAVRGAAGGATAERAQNETLGRLQSAASEATGKFATEEQRESQNASDKLSAVSSDIQKFVNDAAVPIRTPQQAMAEWGADKKIAFLFASALGGATGYSTGKGGNAFLENFDQFVNADIQRQKDERKQKSEQAEQSKSVYWMLHSGFKDDAAARAGTRAMYLQALESRVKEAAIKYQIDSSNPRYQALLSQIDTARAHEIEALAKITGTSTTVQSNDRFVPPSVTAVAAPGALDAKAVAKGREDIGKKFQDRKIYDQIATNDALRTAILAADKGQGGVIQRLMVQHPDWPMSDIYTQLGQTPEGKKYLVNIGQYVIKSGHADFGAAFTEGEQRRQLIFRNPEYLGEIYDRNAADTTNNIAGALSEVPYGYVIWKGMREEQRDMKNLPGSLVQGVGTRPLAESLPEPPE